MSGLTAILDSLSNEHGEYRLEAPEAWSQGRTLFGGMTAALSYWSIRKALGDLGPLRSAQFAFVAPAKGMLRFQPALLRRGRSAAVASADCWTADGIAARSTFTFGRARDSEISHDFTPPLPVPPSELCSPFHKTDKPLAGFLGQFEFRLAAGGRLFETDKRPEFAVWTRLRDGDGADPVATLLAVGDALPGAAMVRFPRLAPISTMTWGFDFYPETREASGWYLISSSSQAAHNGYSLQEMRVYNEQGEPLAAARQVVAVFL
ncbi:thioesterase family protein [Sphingomonas sp. BIUV-7]|uniref:Thioesterase family protein n=1 Tax=Sphingomonas natans TaxID=3063330 RepID=A0ABT8Y9E9_9SPHN|nr:thioesterase family protein [Sphingomonas sp. BIUV-7]MDO6414953.1 thioesterase family protein [Sphingomonas sp. BIUV-7]